MVLCRHRWHCERFRPCIVNTVVIGFHILDSHSNMARSALDGVLLILGLAVQTPGPLDLARRHHHVLWEDSLRSSPTPCSPSYWAVDGHIHMDIQIIIPSSVAGRRPSLPVLELQSL
jgi:hypothetical protein